jgi:hypothetical protein
VLPHTVGFVSAWGTQRSSNFESKWSARGSTEPGLLAGTGSLSRSRFTRWRSFACYRLPLGLGNPAQVEFLPKVVPLGAPAASGFFAQEAHYLRPGVPDLVRLHAVGFVSGWGTRRKSNFHPDLTLRVAIRPKR